MLRISLFDSGKKATGEINVRFRLREGRDLQLIHKTEIRANVNDLAKFDSDGTPKPRCIFNKKLHDDIKAEKDRTEEVYNNLINECYWKEDNGKRSLFSKEGAVVTSAYFEQRFENYFHPIAENSKELYSCFEKFIADSLKNNVIGERRCKNYKVVLNILNRYLIISKNDGILIDEVDGNFISDFRQFIIDEYKFVNCNISLYAGLSENNIPKQQRKTNTASSRLKMIQAFFAFLEDTGKINKSPFRMLGRAKRTILRQKYDEPVYLTSDEFFKVLSTDVPATLQECKDTFLLHCSLGCRIGDFKSLDMAKVDVSDGIPFVHYLPEKTKGIQSSNKEIETPILPYSLEIIKKYGFRFPLLNYVSGQNGYNAKIKKLLQCCGIDRKVVIFDESLNDNVTKPLYECGSSKLARKTFVDMMAKVQINLYASGLHKEGSTAVNHYTSLGLKERYSLMCMAFNQNPEKVDKNLNKIL